MLLICEITFALGRPHDEHLSVPLVRLAVLAHQRAQRLVTKEAEAIIALAMRLSSHLRGGVGVDRYRPGLARL